MKQSLWVLMMGIVAVASVSCSKSCWPGAKSSSEEHAATATKADSNDRAIEQDERAIEFQAQQSKRMIDSMAREAEDAIKKARANEKAAGTVQSAKARAAAEAQAREAKAEADEEAKDRAEDAPDEARNPSEGTEISQIPRSRIMPAFESI